MRSGSLGLIAGPQRRDAVLQQPQVSIEAHGLGETRLLGPQQVAGAAQLEVLEGEAVPGPQLGVLLEQLQTALGVGGQIGRHDEVAEGALMRAPDAAAKLIKLGEPEVVGSVDDHRVGVGDIETVLDDGGGDQNLRVAPQEFDHRPFQLTLGHLAVSDGNTLVWDQPPHLDGDLLDRLHPVVHEEDLAAAIDLQPDGVLDRLIVPGHHVGDDRLTVAGWRAN